MELKQIWDVLANIMDAPLAWISIVTLLIVAVLWAVTRVMKSDGQRESKALWIIVLVFVPVLGLLAWAVAGPKAKTAGSDPLQQRN
ncbi:PLD nuclease N-terminal domain-containing protein [Pseudomonas sp. DSP3-2-2]|jgi:hypothetical protein|uniref:PLD nuclease N-terminal domain-containing protein n=1 Tax=unclassified Pseudomonas TaxID=196821 RepID=UPI003CF7DA76